MSWSSDKSVALSWEFRDDSEIVGSNLIWDVLVARERETRNAAAWNAWRMLGAFLKTLVNFDFFVRLVDATVQGVLFLS